jgi:hypothetical protein
MNLYQVNLFLKELTERMEFGGMGLATEPEKKKGKKGKKGKKQGKDDCEAAGGRWVTVHGTHICVGGKKKGKKRSPVIFGPGGLHDPKGTAVTTRDLPRDKRGRFVKAQKHVGEIMGDREHDLEVTVDKDGNPEVGHPDVDEKVKVGDDRKGVFSGMLSFLKILQDAAVKAAGALGSKLVKAGKDLYDALDEFSQKGQT